MRISVKLHIRDHCIETEVKKEFKRRMDNCFSSDKVTREDEERLQLLGDFIQTSDFAKLRSQDKRLSGEIESYISLYRDENNNIVIEYL